MIMLHNSTYQKDGDVLSTLNCHFHCTILGRRYFSFSNTTCLPKQ